MPLMPADILAFKCTKDSPIIDRAIGFMEHHFKQDTSSGADYYHVAVISADTTMMYSAQPPRINLYPIPNPLPSYVEVYRTKIVLTPDQLKNMFEYADSRKGYIYDYLGCLTGALIEIDGLQFCSKYTNDIFSWGDVVICPDQKLISPNCIVSSPAIQKVTL